MIIIERSKNHLARLVCKLHQNPAGINDTTFKENESHFFKRKKNPKFRLNIPHQARMHLESLEQKRRVGDGGEVCGGFIIHLKKVLKYCQVRLGVKISFRHPPECQLNIYSSNPKVICFPGNVSTAWNSIILLYFLLFIYERREKKKARRKKGDVND